MRRFPFTVEDLERLKPAAREYYVWDDGPRGQRRLCLRVLPSGFKSFYYRRKLAGRSERIWLGEFPGLTIENARGAAGGHGKAVADGKNPAAERRSVKQETTLAELWTEYLAKHAKPYLRESSRKAVEWLWSKHLAEWGSRRLSAIRAADVKALHGSLGSKEGRSGGRYLANRVLALLRHMIRMAGEWGWQGEDPCRGVKAFPEHARERYLEGPELERLFRELALTPEATRDQVVLALLTAARRSNIQAMEWAELDLDGALWRVPGAKMKGGKAHVIPLVPQAVELLRDRKAAQEALAVRVAERAAGGKVAGTQREAKRWAREAKLAELSRWVFPAPTASGHVREYKRAWDSLLKRAGIRDLRFHDLRRSLASWQAALGASTLIVQKTIGDTDPEMALVYARLGTDPVRRSLEETTTAMLQAAKVAPAGEVVTFAKGGKR